MKINALMTAAVLNAALLMTACNNKQPQMNTPQSVAQVAASAEAAPRLAYVEIDSLLTQYEFCIEQKQALESKSKSYEAQIAGKMAQMEKAYGEFQQKMQKGAFTSEEQARAAQQRIQKLQQEGAQLEQQLSKKMAADQERFNTTLRDSVRSFLNDYNKTQRYQMILSKQGDNVLYADSHLDITKEVIAGMNKRYKKSK